MPLFKILLIDANTTFSTTFSALLRRTGYQVEVADTLPDGLTQFNRDGADLVLLGIASEKVASEELSHTFASCKTILLLSSDEKRRDDSPQKGRVKDHLAFYKPFRTEEVLAAIYTALVARPTAA